MNLGGLLGERLREAWAELGANPGRSCLQALAVVLGVASVLGGFAITDSTRRQSEQWYVRRGGLDKLNVHPRPLAKTASPGALQAANRGLRRSDAEAGAALAPEAVTGFSEHRYTSALVRSPHAAQERMVNGIGADYAALEGYALDRGRGFAAREAEGAPVAVLGSEAVRTFFPEGDPVGRTLVLAGVPVVVVGTFRPQEFRYEPDGPNLFAWRNRIIAVPAAFIARRLEADPHVRLDRISFRVPDPGRIQRFSQDLAALLRASHRGLEDFRMDDVAARVRRQQRQGAVYDLVFLVSGMLALLGGGIVNVNIQLASLRERVREVGLRMALGASGREVFLAFMTEALLLTGLGAVLGLAAGVGCAWAITRSLKVALYLRPDSFLWALGLAALCGFAFALVPAFKASRMSPMEALRHE
jgi:ABC-type antimicrobial peptide transport system permease subunit